MKVICIKDDFYGQGKPLKDPVFGNIYTVTGTDERYGYLAYSFKELGSHDYFAASHFIPLSNIDETELLHERQTELV